MRRLFLTLVYLVWLTQPAFGQDHVIGPSNELNILDYGAVCDGSTDDHAAIQAAVDAAEAMPAGRILWPAKTCATSTTITINDTSTQRFVSIVGVNPVQSVLTWTGANSGAVALKISHNLDFEVRNLGISNSTGGSKADSIGLLLTADADVGTRTYGATIDHLFVSGFHVCTQAGQFTNFATSEIIWNFYSATSCDIGWQNGSLNTLNQVFFMASGSANATSAFNVNSGNAYFYGGAMAGNAIDFDVSNSGMTFEVANIRTETPGIFLQVTPSGRQNISVRNCMVGASTNGDNILISLSGGELALIDNNEIAGKVYVRDVGGNGELRMTGNMVFGNQTTLTPFWNKTDSASNGHLRFSSAQNQHWAVDQTFSGTAVRYPDEVADLSGPGDITQRLSMYRITHDPSAAAGAVNHLQLMRVSSLAQGSITPAKNLRLEETFATSATKAVTFVRSVTVSVTSGSTAFTATAGVLNAADVGKKIVFVAADGSGGDVTCFLRSQDTTTAYTADHCAKASGVSATAGVTGSVTATLGENEPDTNYMLMLGCNADERVSWSSKATTGFTLTSSNASSTATCDVLVVR